MFHVNPQDIHRLLRFDGGKRPNGLHIDAAGEEGVLDRIEALEQVADQDGAGGRQGEGGRAID